jgi:hypothetical protein
MLSMGCERGGEQDRRGPRAIQVEPFERIELPDTILIGWEFAEALEMREQHHARDR